ncbi:MAG: diphthine--ammonia ligase [Dehalococcoidia bacterium]|nr:diphthine--ammonia ligase [Dehalococcoidia bacterium]
MVEKVLFSWSGGKDSAMALHTISRDQRYEVVGLLTTVTEGYNRISMHGVREALLEQQASSIGLPLSKVFLSQNSSNEEYEAKMKEVMLKTREAGISAVAFGDIFLYEIKKYRESNLAKVGMNGIFPIWAKGNLPQTFIDLGFQAIVTCVDAKVLDAKFAGRLFNGEFLDELPTNVDPNGENGEFHSFVFDGPIFQHEISYAIGQVVKRDSFYFCDLKPQGVPQ